MLNIKGYSVTCFWKEERGRPYYRFQTSDVLVRDKMKRRKKIRLVGWGMNCSLWIFIAEFSRPDIAKNAFKTITGEKIHFDDREEIFYPESVLSKIKKREA